MRGNSSHQYYNSGMARGWDSKSVEAQIEQSDSESFLSENQGISEEERQAMLKRKDLLLSRRRIVQQLEGSTSERYSELLRRTLAGLDAQISALA